MVKMDIDENLKCTDCNHKISYNGSYLTQSGAIICEKCAAPFLASLNTKTTAIEQDERSKTLSNTVLEKLKCSTCEGYLSCGPVYIDKNGLSICGRCSSENTISRNTPYEALAHFMKFPCRFQKFGCTETVSFADNADIEHENKCLFKRESCPLMISQCKWMGLHEEILSHCQQEHKDRIVDNPLSLTYDVNLSSSCTFLLTAHNYMFTFHTKVCLETNNIYHIIQYLDKSDLTIPCKFDYNVSAVRNNKMVRRVGQIVPHGKLNYSSKDFIVTNIKHLEKALGGLDECIFNININKLSKPKSKCVKCSKNIEKFLYQENGYWLCETCIPEKRTTCKNQGCSHSDLEKKCQKHELFFCPHGTWCWICIKDVRKGDFMNHYKTKHLDASQKPEMPWEISQTGIYDKIMLLPTKIGNIVVKYRFAENDFMIQIRTAILSQDLHDYYCILKLYMADDNLKSKTYVLNTLYNEMHDWKLDVKKNDFPKWGETMCVVINIDKGPKPRLLGLKNVVYQ